MQKNSYEITVVCPSLTASVGHFNNFRHFFRLFVNVTYFQHLRNSCLIFAEILFLLFPGSKGLQNRVFCFFFRKFSDFIFLKTLWSKNYCNTWLPIPSFMIGISLALVYFPKALQSVKLGIHSEDIYDLVSFVYWSPINRCPMKS